MAEKNRRPFRLSYRVTRALDASPERVFALLTDAEAMARWNSTITRLEGPIALGQRLAIEVPIAPGRTFRPRVTTLEPPRRMVWSDGMAPMFRGMRTFTVEPRSGSGGVDFTMEEVFSGILVPLIAAGLPDFRPVFDSWVDDLQRAIEGGTP